MNTLLLKTKLYIPATRPELVSRQRLIERLNEGLKCKLILVTAPAGYGKTTLLSAWAAQCGCPVAWLSLDEGDTNPTRFLMYLIAALQTIEANLGRDILTALQSAQSSAIADWLPVFVDQLDTLAGPAVLVLDDYHAITTPEIQQALTFLLEHLPSQLHLVLATRKDPPLPVPRLRARGQLTELRQADLRFTFEEATAFLKQGMGVELSPADARSLASRTEGWIAGLQMAALSLRDKDDVSGLIAAFGGRHEYIVDYFASEVLAQQPEPLRAFLLQTSILERMCGGLCEAVTCQTAGQQTLEQLQHANLFVVPLDGERNWYRYHHLFRELLRKQLQHEAADSLPELHRRASQWCEEHELIDEAIEHTLAAHDEHRLSRLLDEYAEQFFLRGEHVTLTRWIAALPEAQRRMRPALGIFQAIMLSAAGNGREAERVLQEVDQTLANLDEAIVQNRQLLGRVAAAHTMLAAIQDNAQAILFHARRALDLAPDETGWHSSVLLASSNADFLMGDLAACVANLSKAAAIATARDNHVLVLVEMAKLAQTHWMQGHLNQAEQVCQAGLQYIDRKNLTHSPASDHVFLTWGAILSERSDLDQAAEFIRHGLELSRAGHVVLNELFAYRSLVRIRFAQHNPSAAEELLHRAEDLIREHDVPFQHTSPIISLKAQLLILHGRLGEAEHELQVLDAQSDTDPPFIHHGRLYLSQAQLRIAQRNLPAAEQTLDRLFKFSQASGQHRWMIPIQILRAVLRLGRQDMPHALNALELAMELAEPEGFVQDFLDEGEPMIPLLHEAVRRKVKPEFARLLLNRLSSDRPAEKPIGLVEPLSEREIEVLKLVAEGLSNQEIASQLYLSLRTIKFHTGNIFGKLNVKSRTEAVAKARDLGLLSS